MAAGDLCAAADVKAYLGKNDAGDDTLLAGIVSAASAWLASQIGRDITSQAYNETRSGDGTGALRLRQSPVITVQSLTVDGIAVTPRDANNEGWALQDDWLLLSGPSSGAGMSGPYGPYVSGTKMTTLRYTIGLANVVIGYTAGYATVPPDLKQAAVELVGETFQRRDRLGMMSRSLGGEVMTAFQTLSLNVSLKSTIAAYQVVRL